MFAPDGLGKLELTDNGTIEEYSPDWSPDATRIVFVSNRQIPGGTVTRTRLWIMDADGSDPIQFTAPFATNSSGTTVQDEHPVLVTRRHVDRLRPQPPERQPVRDDQGGRPGGAGGRRHAAADDDTDHTFDLPDWQPLPVEP